jgi:hypothetical protein
MTIYLSIDGDDIGSKIARSYLENDEINLSKTIQHLSVILNQISEHMRCMGLEVIFCAADGILCKGQTVNYHDLAHYIKHIGEPHFTFSVGIGTDVQSSFFALKYAKAIGKNRIVVCDENSKFKVVDVPSI